jgi:hypothetical protein
METCAAEMTIYVPPGSTQGELADLFREMLPDHGIPFAGPIALTCEVGGTLVLRHDTAPYGKPYGIELDDLPPGVDADIHVQAHWQWEAVIVWLRAGVRLERASASESPEPLMAEADLDRLIKGTEGDRAALELCLRTFFVPPAPSYDVGARRIVVDWDGEVTNE